MPRMFKAGLPRLVDLGLVTLAFFAIALFALKTFGTASPVWLSNAIVVVALLRNRSATWPAFLALAWIADALALVLFGEGPPYLLALCDTVEILGVATIIRRTCGVKPSVFESRQAGWMVLAFVAVPLVSSAGGAALLFWTEGAPFLVVWRIWYSSSTLGLLLVTPLLIGWSQPQVRQTARGQLTPAGGLAIAAGATLAVVCVVQSVNASLLFLSFPIVMAMTWTYGFMGASVGLVAVGAAVVTVTLRGHGALLDTMPAAASVERHVEAVQLYLVAILFTSLPLAVLLSLQRELAHHLRRAGQARAEFLAAMSHEIRTPMTGVLGMIDLLSAEELSPMHRGYVDGMKASGRHLLSVINDILDFSRFESGQLELEHTSFSLPDLLERTRSLVNPQAVERGLGLHIELNPHSPPILMGDPMRLKQVLLNLVGNAIKFTDRGAVTVAVSQTAVDAQGMRIRFEVRDTGSGIAAENLERLFVPFTQEDRSISRRFGGSGLGLAISKRLVEAMGGEIGVRSTLGLGSLFYFEVPLKFGDPLTAVVPLDPIARVVRPRRILIAEDVEINREILRTRLGKRGHSLVFAHDGAQALDLVQRQAFDLVLMDVQMPVMDGVDATRRIRKLPAPFRDLPILGLTANVMARERERYLAAGMTECLMKPIDWNELEDAIDRHGDGDGDGDNALASAAPTTRSPQGLVDTDVLGALREVAGPDDMNSLIQLGMGTYAGYCEAMLQAPNGAPGIRREVHKLKGSAGTMGLVLINDIASRIDTMLNAGGGVEHLVHELKQAIIDTRNELVTLGFVAAS